MKVNEEESIEIVFGGVMGEKKGLTIVGVWMGWGEVATKRECNDHDEAEGSDGAGMGAAATGAVVGTVEPEAAAAVADISVPTVALAAAAAALPGGGGLFAMLGTGLNSLAGAHFFPCTPTVLAVMVAVATTGGTTAAAPTPPPACPATPAGP